MKKIKLNISGMHCTSCAMNIDGELEDTDGVKQANTNYAKQNTEVEFDENKLEIKDILNIVSKTGYQAQLSTKE